MQPGSTPTGNMQYLTSSALSTSPEIISVSSTESGFAVPRVATVASTRSNLVNHVSNPMSSHTIRYNVNTNTVETVKFIMKINYFESNNKEVLEH